MIDHGETIITGGWPVKPCCCTSYNGDEPPYNDMVVELPGWLRTLVRKDTVCIDRCIVEDIKKLWAANIPTFGCCCGHNGRFERSIIVDTIENEAKAAALVGDSFLIWSLERPQTISEYVNARRAEKKAYPNPLPGEHWSLCGGNIVKQVKAVRSGEVLFMDGTIRNIDALRERRYLLEAPKPSMVENFQRVVEEVGLEAAVRGVYDQGMIDAFAQIPSIIAKALAHGERV